MLLRNLDPYERLCNGTRLIVKKVVGNVLVATHHVDGEERTVMRVGVFLPEWVFGHGQLYVAESRVVHPDNIRFCVLHRPPEIAELGRSEATVPTEEQELQLIRREFEKEESLLAMDHEEEIEMLRRNMEEGGDEDEEAMMMREVEYVNEDYMNEDMYGPKLARRPQRHEGR